MEKHRDAIAYGGDYNPEQWPEEVWLEDMELMRRAGVNLVSVGIHSWALLEPAEGVYEFGWLDRLLDLLHEHGIRADLATPTVAPPAWLRLHHPDSRSVDRDGHVLGGGTRQSYCPSSPSYAAACATITERLAARYADHPALVMWHVSNEYGWGPAHCYCEVSAEAFRVWLREKHHDLDTLNAAWGTSFWGQRYGGWAEIEPPRTAPPGVNPALQLDFLRFSQDAHLANFRRERDIIRRHSAKPVTTNFQLANCKWIDYWKWAREVDVVSNDHYLQAERLDNQIELAMCADLTRSVAGGEPWLLMEHSTGAVNWQPRNLAKLPGELARNSLSHLARGADGIMFFQWRASAFGAEKFHSAMLPHGGPGTRIHREVVALGADLEALAPVRGGRVEADVAIVWDWESWWAVELEWRPSADLGYRERIEAYYEQLWRANLTTDFVHPEGDLARYRMVVVPSLYLTTPAAAKNLAAYVADGGTLVVSYFSGIVDAMDTVHPGAYPGALRDVLGLTVEEFLPLRTGQGVTLSGGMTGDLWSEDVITVSAEVVAEYLDGPAAGRPAITRNSCGEGTAWYISTRLPGDDLRAVLDRACADAGLVPDRTPVEIVRRGGHVFALNHSGRDVPVKVTGHELLTGTDCAGTLQVPAGKVRIVREPGP
ncbi:beta-galactosidase [Actinocorallia longicatena]|uniref:Beta-galactosidase n=1 Tax=Actinocorallia longicatena TaxID=111803 RepID=A0ABP6PVL5_9ACTN